MSTTSRPISSAALRLSTPLPRHPEVLAVLHGEPRRIGHKRKRSILRDATRERGSSG
jgi:hypothetical protein